MRRRQLMRYAGASLLTAMGTTWASGFKPSVAQNSDRLSIQWLGHTCFLFTGGGQRVLVNPFRNIGCTAGYRPPNVETDLVLISSQLLDEGAIETLPGNPRLLYEPGVYQMETKQIQGIRTDHDREGGRRFGVNVAWRWQQAGINILHLGGIAGPISVEQRILLGTPDIVFIPVGGGPKAYNPTEARQALQTLSPKLIVPTHYRTQAADNICDIVALDEFLNLMDGTPVRRTNSDTLTLTQADLPSNGSEIKVMSYRF
ncbi:MAG: MBL fold metallo-hydrolase [Desertifilum sp. SIO1I2]|nr:MBL fold metallo-hydrolase [Desertifilum sp. SIO1I2]